MRNWTFEDLVTVIGLQDGSLPGSSHMWVMMLQLLQDNPLYASTGHKDGDGNGPRRSFFFRLKPSSRDGRVSQRCLLDATLGNLIKL